MMTKAKGRREDCIGSKSMISELPEGILQRIIYFLSQEEAARTSVFSKSWRYTWCTRSNIEFSETTFKGSRHEFLSAVDKTLQRYCDQGPPLEEFSLCISLLGGEDGRAHHESVSLLDTWIPIILTTMGVALKEFRLSIVSEEQNSLSEHPCLVYDLIGELLVDNKKIHFERLQVLALQRVFVEQETFDKLISSTIEIDDIPTLETIKFVGNKIRFRGGHKFNNLESITLQLPWSFGCNEEINIDAPNLLNFEYSGRPIPSISYAPNCRRSNIALSIWGGYHVQSWFLKTSELLQSLSHSEISLHIVQFHSNILFSKQDTLVRDIINGAGIKPVVVEHLQLFIEHLYSFPSFLNVFFTICRPRNIVQRWTTSLMDEKAKKEIIEYLRTLLTRRQDLEDLSIERLDQRGQWRPVQGMKLLECAQSQRLSINCIRCRMKWRILSN